MRHLGAWAAAPLVLALVPGGSAAACKRPGGFAVQQCADRAWVAPPPEGAGSVAAVFWQIGFGNETINNGEGAAGVGIAPPGTFNGNDSGLAAPVLRDAPAALGDPAVPGGAICLDPFNWGNVGVDGCCDNARDPTLRGAEDGLLNPYFDPRVLRAEGKFVRSLERIQDYPMAVLLREETGRWFAAAAVASASRNGSVEDLRPGHFTFADLVDGEANPLTGRRNVLPWQETPAPTIAVLGPGGGPGRWRVKASWPAARVAGDASRRPSEAYEVTNPGKGVGVADMGPLVRYVVEKVHLTLSMMDDDGYPIKEILVWEAAAEADNAEAELELGEDNCLRIAVHLGKRPRTRAVSVNTCALGRCGDVGYRVTGPPACLEGELLRAAGRRPRA